MKLRTVTAVAAVVLATAISAGAAHAELVTNGGFETGDFTGWTQTGNTGATDVSDGAVAASGTFGAFFGPVGSPGGITQSLVTVSGAAYVVSYDLLIEGGTPSSALVTFGGQTVLSLINPVAAPFTHHSVVVSATGSLTNLAFSFQDDPDFFFLDNVSVQAVEVPEPATWATVIVGLGMVGAARGRRRRIAAA
jgi:hypothetical protein